MRALLDVNVLIALLDAAHVHHRRATAWLGGHLEQGWASCPITQIGCIRILAQPGYPSPLPAAEVAARLAEATADESHAFWPDSVDAVGSGSVSWNRVLGPRQVTDSYLLALAVAHGGRLVTFDRRIDPAVVPNARPAHLVTIA